MIGLKQNKNLYDYDIRTLLQAFFKNEKIVIDGSEDHFTFVAEYSDSLKGHTFSIWENDKCMIERAVDGNYEEKMEFRNPMKRVVYEMLSEYTGKKLPWGTLTGIRPAKICYRQLDEGKTEEEIVNDFQQTYLTTRQKAELTVKVAKKERYVLKNIDYKDQYSLYIGIPFCPSRCLYCSFTSFPIERYQEIVDDYLDALIKEIDFIAEEMKDYHLISIYIGGGTPTSITAVQLKKLLDKIEQSFDFSYLKEFTIEAGRADSITEEKLWVIKESRADRISINPQTMKDETLRFIGRKHTVDQVFDAYRMARKIDIGIINMDMIAGLPMETLEDVSHTLEQIKLLQPENLTVHSLAIKRAANLNIEKERYLSCQMGPTNEMLEQADFVATKMGLEPYYMYRQKNIPGNLENIGYAKPGTEGIYNMLIMEEKQTILAIGAGAASKYVFGENVRIERTENVKDVEEYIKRIDEMIERKKEKIKKWKQEIKHQSGR